MGHISHLEHLKLKSYIYSLQSLIFNVKVKKHIIPQPDQQADLAG